MGAPIARARYEAASRRLFTEFNGHPPAGRRPQLVADAFPGDL